MSKNKEMKGYVGFAVVNRRDESGEFGIPMAVGYNRVEVLAKVWTRLQLHTDPLRVNSSDIEISVRQQDLELLPIETFEKFYKEHLIPFLKTIQFRWNHK